MHLVLRNRLNALRIVRGFEQQQVSEHERENYIKNEVQP